MNDTVKSRRIRSLALLGCALGLAWLAPVMAQPAAERVRLEFVKENPDGDGTWAGTVTGAFDGSLQTVLVNADQSQPVWRVAFEGIVDAGADSFRAHVGGTLDTSTGQVEMTGVVTEGGMLGASIAWEGQLVDEAASRFEGTIIITPAAASPAEAATFDVGAHGHLQGAQPWYEAPEMIRLAVAAPRDQP